MRSFWGVPEKHSTMHEVYYELWKETEDKLIQKEEAKRKNFLQEIKDILNC
jgi:hypothetical protein